VDILLSIVTDTSGWSLLEVNFIIEYIDETIKGGDRFRAKDLPNRYKIKHGVLVEVLLAIVTNTTG
jgi:hypothetical protein